MKVPGARSAIGPRGPAAFRQDRRTHAPPDSRTIAAKLPREIEPTTVAAKNGRLDYVPFSRDIASYPYCRITRFYDSSQIATEVFPQLSIALVEYRRAEAVPRSGSHHCGLFTSRNGAAKLSGRLV
jgi:hypothetical protein